MTASGCILHLRKYEINTTQLLVWTCGTNSLFECKLMENVMCGHQYDIPVKCIRSHKYVTLILLPILHDYCEYRMIKCSLIHVGTTHNRTWSIRTILKARPISVNYKYIGNIMTKSGRLCVYLIILIAAFVIYIYMPINVINSF